MTIWFRILLFLAAILSLQLVLRNIRKSKLLISDSLFWIFFSAILVILAVFPQIAYAVSDLLGIQSPVNLVYLVIIALLIWRVFKLYLRVSSMDTKLKELAQRIALNENKVPFQKENVLPNKGGRAS